MTGPAELLVVHDLGVAYDGVPALVGVSFAVGRGELVAVVGPNGAGKSTLFKAVVGLVPHTGRVSLDGAHCHHRRDRLRAAYLPQRSEVDLAFPLTVGQLVLSGRRPFIPFGRRPGSRDRRVALDCMRRVGVEGLVGRPLGTLSGGQIQRAFLARALAQEPHALLIDEALSGVDQPRTERLLDLFGQLCDDGVTIMVATHDLALARRRFARCLAVNHRLVADGVPATALDPAALDVVFGTAPPSPPPADPNPARSAKAVAR